MRPSGSCDHRHAHRWIEAKWLRQAEIDSGIRPVKNAGNIAEIKELKRENAELCRANEVLKVASAFFVVELGHPYRF